MTFRRSILVSLTAVMITAGCAATTTAGATAPAPPTQPAATWYPSLDCTGRIEMRSCLVELRHDTDPDTTWDQADALGYKVDNDLPLAGNDDSPPTRIPVRHGGIWQ
jgi:hypothetical protein